MHEALKWFSKSSLQRLEQEWIRDGDREWYLFFFYQGMEKTPSVPMLAAAMENAFHFTIQMARIQNRIDKTQPKWSPGHPEFKEIMFQKMRASNVLMMMHSRMEACSNEHKVGIEGKYPVQMVSEYGHRRRLARNQRPSRKPSSKKHGPLGEDAIWERRVYEDLVGLWKPEAYKWRYMVKKALGPVFGEEEAILACLFEFLGVL